jgi:hypothetical protein
MYIFEEMLSLAGQKWKTPAHRKVASKLLINNPRVTRAADLVHFGSLINSMTSRQVKALTFSEAVKLGFPVPHRKMEGAYEIPRTHIS